MVIDKYDQRTWIFGDETAGLFGNLFSKALPQCAGKALSHNDCSLLKDIVELQSYEQSYQQRFLNMGAKPIDIPAQVADFIVVAAHWARLIDKPTGIGAIIQDIKNTINGRIGPTTIPTINNVQGILNLNNQNQPSISNLLNQLNVQNANISNLVRNALNTTAAQFFATNPNILNLQPNQQNQLANQLQSQLINAINNAVKGQFQAAYTKISDSNEAKKLYNNALSKYNEMDNSTQAFYDRYIGIYDLNGNEIPKSNIIAQNNFNQYRINFKKNQIGSNVTQLEADLPLINQGTTTIFITDLNGNPQQYNVKGQDILKELFNTVYNGTQSKIVAQNYQQAVNNLMRDGPYFKIRVDDLIRKRLFKAMRANVGIPEPKKDDIDTYIDIPNKNTIFRDSNGKFYIKKDGKKIPYDINDPETIRVLKASHKCYSTFIDADEASCNRYMFECLLGNDPNQLKVCYERLKLVKFYENARAEINQMHGAIAVRTLQRHGFRKYKVFDNTLGMQIYKIEDCDHWLEHVAKKNGIDPIADGVEFILKYLCLLVQYVNQNPGILNKGIDGETDEAIGKFEQSDYLNALNIKPRIEPAGDAECGYEVSKFKKYFGSNLFGVTRQNVPFFGGIASGQLMGPFGMAIQPGMQMIRQSGGEYIIDSGNRCPSELCNAKLMQDIFNDLKTNLANKGKKLDAASEQKIANVIDKISTFSTQATQMLAVIQEYNDLIYALNDYKTETLSIQKLNEIISRYGKVQDRYRSTENYAIKILDLLQKLAGEEGIDGNGNMEKLVLN